MNDATPIPGTLPAITVGGGLAGAAFAIELARSGRRVLVLERSRGPHHAVCGEFLSEAAQVVLGSLGIDLQGLGSDHAHSLSPCQGRAPGNLRLPFAAAGLSRFRIDEALLAAATRAGAEVVRGASVRGSSSAMARSRYGPKAGCGRPASWPSLRASIPCAALPARGLDGGLQAASRADRRGDPGTRGIVQLAFFRGGYVGACLVEDGILSVAWVMQDHLVRTVGSDWPRNARISPANRACIGDLLAGARPLFARPVATAAIPYGFRGATRSRQKCSRSGINSPWCRPSPATAWPLPSIADWKQRAP